eukprot:TRINITY_DN7449_c0_g3_i1.p1 TRINITY_DN7449_c0_g3~~TRINITY_DN7449_c0_g3_i1.p1  ORF type:complete len:278 (+),score=32.86 TRINITY_DN7449_c0_g3_i1:254-1087(+)
MDRVHDEETRRRSLAPEAIVPVLACVLNQLCSRNDQLSVEQAAITKFHALKPPSISIRDYLERIAKYAACSGECFVLCLVYIDRIIQNNHAFVVNSLNVHRLLITSIMLAAKFFDDQYFNNAYYAKVGGVPCGEMNSLEIEFLFMLNFNLFAATDTFTQYYHELCKHTLNSPCDCRHGNPLFALKVDPPTPEYDISRRITPALVYTNSTNSDSKLDLMSTSPPSSQAPANSDSRLRHLIQSDPQPQSDAGYAGQEASDSHMVPHYRSGTVPVRLHSH